MHFIENDFKTIQFAIFFTDYDDKKRNVYRFLLPKLLTSHTDDMPYKAQMHETLEHLYGAYFKLRTERMANLNVVSMTLTIPNPKIVNDPNLLQDAVQLIKKTIFNRVSFSKDIFDEEKRLLIEQWQTLKDKKKLYAQTKFNEYFFKQDLYGYPLSGKLSDIKKVTLEELETYYQEAFINDRIDIIVNGHLNHEEKAYIKTHLSLDHVRILNEEMKFKPAKEKTVIFEKTKMSQAHLKLGYRLPIYRKDRLYDAAVLFDIILGGYPDSLLFKEIREKRGLCYDIHSSYDGYKGVLMISSGVDLTKKEEALEAIQTLVEDMKQDLLLDHTLAYAKAFYIHQLKSSLDSQSTLTKRAFIRDLMHQNDTFDARILNIENVTLEDMIQVINQVTLDTIYVLHGGESDVA